MSAGVLGEIDELRCAPHSADGGLGYIFGIAGQRNDTTIVIRIALAVQQENSRHFAHSGDDGVDLG